MKNKLVTLDVGQAGDSLSLPTTEKAVRLLWEGLCELDKAVPPRRIPRAILFGSARVPRDHRIYIETRQMACAIAEKGYDVVTGGGPGLMAAANEGAMEGMKKNPRAWSHGVCIEQIHRVEPPNDFLKRVYRHRLIYTRLHEFVRLGYFGAFILAEAGGYGSDLEKALVHQLRQFKQLGAEVIGIGPMWRERRDWERKWIIEPGWADPEDLDLMTLVDTPMQAVPLVIAACERVKARMAAG